jgi:hypothetical protein
VLYPHGTNADAMADDIGRLRTMPRLRGLRRYHVLRQGRAPHSVIPHLQVEAASLVQAWFASLVDLECAAVDGGVSGVAQFACEEHGFSPLSSG